MLLKKFIHSILILTLIIQLFPTNSKGRFVVQNKCKEDSTELPDAKSSPLRQLIEEDHKDILVEHDWVKVHFIQINNSIFHFSEELPVPHFGPIHTPPPNYFA
jgi:hypothetical protein